MISSKVGPSITLVELLQGLSEITRIKNLAHGKHLATVTGTLFLLLNVSERENECHGKMMFGEEEGDYIVLHSWRQTRSVAGTPGIHP